MLFTHITYHQYLLHALPISLLQSYHPTNIRQRAEIIQLLIMLLYYFAKWITNAEQIACLWTCCRASSPDRQHGEKVPLSCISTWGRHLIIILITLLAPWHRRRHWDKWQISKLLRVMILFHPPLGPSKFLHIHCIYSVITKQKQNYTYSR